MDGVPLPILEDQNVPLPLEDAGIPHQTVVHRGGQGVFQEILYRFHRRGQLPGGKTPESGKVGGSCFPDLRPFPPNPAGALPRIEDGDRSLDHPEEAVLLLYVLEGLYRAVVFGEGQLPGGKVYPAANVDVGLAGVVKLHPEGQLAEGKVFFPQPQLLKLRKLPDTPQLLKEAVVVLAHVAAHDLLGKILLGFLHQGPKLLQAGDGVVVVAVLPVLLEGLDGEDEAVQHPLGPWEVVIPQLLCQGAVGGQGGSPHGAQTGVHQVLDQLLGQLQPLQLLLQLLLAGGLAGFGRGLGGLVLLRNQGGSLGGASLLFLAPLLDVLWNFAGGEALAGHHLVEEGQAVLAGNLAAGAGAAEHRIGLIYVIRRCDIIALAASRALPHVERVILRPLKLDKSALLGYLFAV